MKMAVSDLLSMVGGSSSGKVTSGVSAAQSRKMTSNRTPHVSVERKVKEVAPYKLKEVSPDRVIPIGGK